MSRYATIDLNVPAMSGLRFGGNRSSVSGRGLVVRAKYAAEKLPSDADLKAALQIQPPPTARAMVSLGKAHSENSMEAGSVDGDSGHPV